jgi:hypothetical protein
MPIMLRRFWIKKINKMDFDAEAKAEEILAKANAKKSTRKNSR